MLGEWKYTLPYKMDMRYCKGKMTSFLSMRTGSFFSLIFCCIFLVLPIQDKTSIEQAYEAGVLDLETALLYQVQAIHDPDILPAEYRESEWVGSGIYYYLLEADGNRIAKTLAVVRE